MAEAAEKTSNRKGHSGKNKMQATFRTQDQQLALAQHRFREGEVPVAVVGDENKGDVKTLIQGISMGIQIKELTAQDLLDLEYAYLDFIYQNQTYLIPDWTGFCAFCGTTTHRMNYAQQTSLKRETCIDPFGRETQASQSEVIGKIKTDFLAVKAQLGLTGKIPPVVFIATMNNEGDWTTKSELVVTPQNPIETKTSNELDRMIADYKDNAIEAEAKEVE